MNVNVLKYYIELYRQKNLNKASLNLFITPQGLSKAITSLEKELGIQLLKHGYNQIQFTADGDFFYQKAEELWKMYSEMLVELKERAETPTGTLTIGIAYGVNKYLGTDFWEVFQKKYKNITLNLIETTDRQVEQMLKDEIIELGISSCEFDDQVFEGQRIFSVPIHVLCAKGNSLYTKDEISLADLNGKQIITLSDKYKSPEFLRTFLAEHDVSADMTLCASEMSYIWDLCYQKKGITLIPAGSFPFLPPQKSDLSGTPFSFFKEIGFSNTNPMWDVYLLQKRTKKPHKIVQIVVGYIFNSKNMFKTST